MYIFGSMFSISEENGEKGKVKLSLVNNFLINLVQKRNVSTENSTWFLRTFSTQMKTSKFSLCGDEKNQGKTKLIFLEAPK